MKICAMADIHSRFDQFDVRKMPDADLVVIAGDLTDLGIHRRNDIALCCHWLGKLAQRYGAENVMWIPGNHDFGIIDLPAGRCQNILARTAEHSGLKVRGVSLTVAYNMPELAVIWAHTTADPRVEALAFDFGKVDIVVSHGPPYAWPDDWKLSISSDGKDCGSPSLRDYILNHVPQLVICGHIHEGVGADHIDVTHEKRTSVFNVAQQVWLLDNASGRWRGRQVL